MHCGDGFNRRPNLASQFPSSYRAVINSKIFTPYYFQNESYAEICRAARNDKRKQSILIKECFMMTNCHQMAYCNQNWLRIWAFIVEDRSWNKVTTLQSILSKKNLNPERLWHPRALLVFVHFPFSAMYVRIDCLPTCKVREWADAKNDISCASRHESVDYGQVILEDRKPLWLLCLWSVFFLVGPLEYFESLSKIHTNNFRLIQKMYSSMVFYWSPKFTRNRWVATVIELWSDGLSLCISKIW